MGGDVSKIANGGEGAGGRDLPHGHMESLQEAMLAGADSSGGSLEAKLLDPPGKLGPQHDDSVASKPKISASSARVRQRIATELMEGVAAAAPTLRCEVESVLVQELHACGCSETSFGRLMRTRVALAHLVRGLVLRQSIRAQQGLRRRRRGAPPPSAQDDPHAQLLFMMIKLCDASLRALSDERAHEDLLLAPLQVFEPIAQSLSPACFYEQCCRPVAPPEAPITLDPATAQASSVEGVRVPARALSDDAGMYWCSKQGGSGDRVIWSVSAAEPVLPSALTLEWHESGTGGVMAPQAIDVYTSEDGINFRRAAHKDLRGLVLEAVRCPMRIRIEPLGRPELRAQHFRLSLEGISRFNDTTQVSLNRVKVLAPQSGVDFVDPQKVLRDLRGWLEKISSSVPSSALNCLLHLICATGMMGDVLRALNTLLDCRGLDGDLPGLAFDRLLGELDAEELKATARLGMAGRRGLDALRNVAFDEEELSRGEVTLSEWGMLARCGSSSHAHVYANCGFSEGKWAWEFHIAEDIPSDESVCIGAGCKPVSSSSYNSSANLWMYRCYNGNCYRQGTQVPGGSKEQIHPGDVVRVTLDCEARTLSFCINGDRNQGVCFTDVVGEIFPAVAFYGANRAVRLLAVECASASGLGVRCYPPDDAQGRLRWEGSMSCGLRHGWGRLTFRHTDRYWHGTWKHGKMEGLAAWVAMDAATGQVDVPNTLLYVFESDRVVGPATPEDVSREESHWGGWSCSLCQFVSPGDAGSCALCSTLRASQQSLDVGAEPMAGSCTLAGNAHVADYVCTVLQRLSNLADICNLADGVGEGAPASATDESSMANAHSYAHGPGGDDSATQQHLLLQLDLCQPYCLEPTSEALHSLSGLLMGWGSALPWQGLVSGLKLLAANLRRLAASGIVPSDVGILPREGEQLRRFIESLLEDEALRDEVGCAAADAVAAGLRLLCPCRDRRCGLLQSLLARHLAKPFRPGGGQRFLLHNLLVRFAEHRELLSLLPPGSSEEDSLPRDAGCMHLAISIEGDLDGLVTLLLKLVVEERLRTLGRHVADSVDSDDLVHAATALLAALVRQLLTPEALGGWEGAANLLCFVGVSIIEGCTYLTQTALAKLGNAEEVSSWLEDTILRKVLPLLACGVADLCSPPMSDEGALNGCISTNSGIYPVPLRLQLSESLAVPLCDMAAALDALNVLLPAAKAAEAAMAWEERVALQEELVMEKAQGGPRRVSASFDASAASDDVSIEDNGQVMRSTASSNQYCAVNIGFRSGRAAWEFKLESDSVNDECSALGAATKPISVASYDSSPSMWVRRSYNGQLYHGTSVGYPCLARVHPGDIVRVEVDIDNRTMAFRRNGLYEGIAFTDLEGDIFPVVCTYRCGVVVRLLKVEIWPEAGGAGGGGLMTDASRDGERGPSSCESPCALGFDPRGLPGHGAVGDSDGGWSWFSHCDKDRDGVWVTALAFHGINPRVYSPAIHTWQVRVERCEHGTLAFGLTIDTLDARRTSHLGASPHGSWAWLSDATLWANGMQVRAGHLQKLQGRALLSPGDAVCLILDTQRRTLSFSFHGQPPILAFGPEGSGALLESPVEAPPGYLFYPGVSLKSHTDRVALKEGGVGSTVSPPWSFDLEKMLSWVGGRISVFLVSGEPVNDTEVSAGEWVDALWPGGLEGPQVTFDSTSSSLSANGDAALFLRDPTPHEFMMYHELMEGLEATVPEPEATKALLKKKGIYDFPREESLFLRCVMRLASVQSLLDPEALMVRQHLLQLRGRLRLAYQSPVSNGDQNPVIFRLEGRISALLSASVATGSLVRGHLSVPEALRLCTRWILGDHGLSGENITEVLHRRRQRAMHRRTGLMALRRLLSSASFNSVRVDALAHAQAPSLSCPCPPQWLRTAAAAAEEEDPLKGGAAQVILASTVPPPRQGAAGRSRLRETAVRKSTTACPHYLSNLSGVPASTTMGVTEEFWAISRTLLSLLPSAVQDCSVALTRGIMGAWGLAFTEADAVPLVAEGLVRAVSSLLSLSAVLDPCAGPAVLPLPPYIRNRDWSQWNPDDVCEGIMSGTFTDDIIRAHMEQAPEWTKAGWEGVKQTISCTNSSMQLPVTHVGNAGALLLEYESFVEHVERLRLRRWSVELEADRQAKRQLRRQLRKSRGVRYTYVVTAANGVGVRVAPGTATQRKGQSFKFGEKVEASYRMTLSSGQTYVKLVGPPPGEHDRQGATSFGVSTSSGWVFTTGVRGTYKGLSIMKFVKAETYVAAEEARKELQAGCGTLVTAARSDMVEVLADGRTVYCAGEGPAKPAASLWGDIAFAAADAPPSASLDATGNYFEVIVHCRGSVVEDGRNLGAGQVCIGLAELSWILPSGSLEGADSSKGEERIPQPHLPVHVRPGSMPYSCGLHGDTGALWEDGHRVRFPSLSGDMSELSETSDQGLSEVAPSRLPLRDGDVVGVGIHPITRVAFFTRNGQLLSPACGLISLRKREREMRPIVSMHGKCATVEANFGPWFEYRGPEILLSERARAALREYGQLPYSLSTSALAERCQQEPLEESEGGWGYPTQPFSAEVTEEHEMGWLNPQMTMLERDMLRESSWALMRLLLCRSAALYTDAAVSGNDRRIRVADSLLTACLGPVATELEDCISLTRPEGKPVKAEAAAYQILRFTVGVLFPSLKTAQLASIPKPLKRIENCCFLLLQMGSPRLRRLASRAIKRLGIFSRPSPGPWTGLPWPSRDAFLRWVLETAGESLLPSIGGRDRSAVWGCGSARELTCVTCEMLSLLRSGMREGGEWGELIGRVLCSSVEAAALSGVSCATSSEGWKLICSAAASLAVLGGYDVLRPGGDAVGSMTAGGVVPITQQVYRVVELLAACSQVRVVRMISPTLPGTTARCEANLSAISLLPSASLEPVMANTRDLKPPCTILDAVHSLCKQCATTMHNATSSSLGASWLYAACVAAIRELVPNPAMNPSPSLLQFLVVQAASPLPLNHFVSMRVLEQQCRTLRDHLKEWPWQQEEPDSERSTHGDLTVPKGAGCCPPQHPRPMLYRVILPDGAVVRDGPSIDHSQKVCVLPYNTVVQVIEVQQDPEGIQRCRTPYGWISRYLRGGDGRSVVEPAARAVAEGLLVQRPDIDALLAHMPPRSIPHALHEHPLQLMERAGQNDALASWDCRHCGASFEGWERGFISTVDQGWVICFGCFAMDARALAIAQGKTPTTADSCSVSLLSTLLCSKSNDRREAPGGPIRDEAEGPTDGLLERTSMMRNAAEELESRDHLQLHSERLEESNRQTPHADQRQPQGYFQYIQHQDSSQALLRSSHSTSEAVHEGPDLRQGPRGLLHRQQSSEARPPLSPREHVETGDDMAAALEATIPPLDMGNLCVIRSEDLGGKLHLLRCFPLPRVTIEGAVELSGGDIGRAMLWLSLHGCNYLGRDASGGPDISIYPSVFCHLGFTRQLVESDLALTADHDFEEGILAVDLLGTKKAKDEGEGELFLRHTSSPSTPCILLRERGEAISTGVSLGPMASVDPLEIRQLSEAHRVVAALVCKDESCAYLEFPGCGAHQQLLSVRKPNGAARCAACTCATDVNPPWDGGCRLCRGPMKTYMWAVSIREAQFLLRAFPPHLRGSEDNKAFINILQCSCCNVMGFPGVIGDSAEKSFDFPSICISTPEAPFVLAATGERVPPNSWDAHMEHIGRCPMAGHSLQKVRAQLSFGEAKYLCKTIANMDTRATFLAQARDLPCGTMLVLSSVALEQQRLRHPVQVAMEWARERGAENCTGDVTAGEMLRSLAGCVIGTYISHEESLMVVDDSDSECSDDSCFDPVQHVSGHTRSNSSVGAGVVQSPTDANMRSFSSAGLDAINAVDINRSGSMRITVRILDPARGLALPRRFGMRQLRLLTSFASCTPKNVGKHQPAWVCSSSPPPALLRLSLEAEQFRGVLYARQAIAQLLEALTQRKQVLPPVFEWGQLIDLVRLLASSEASLFARPDGFSGLTPSAGYFSTQQALSAMRAAVEASPGTASRLWQTIGKDMSSRDATGKQLWQALTESAVNHATFAARAAPLHYSASDQMSRSASCQTFESLHPPPSSAQYGRSVKLEGAQGLRVVFDCRTFLPRGEGCSLCFWESEKIAASGAPPFHMLTGDDATASGYARELSSPRSFVMPKTSSLFYVFRIFGRNEPGVDVAPDRPEVLPSFNPRPLGNISLIATNSCSSEFSIGDDGLVECSSGFPSIAAHGILLTGGRWYYEVTVVKNGLAQIGWSDSTFSGDSLKGDGVGDDRHSWGFDGHRVYRWHGGGVRWGAAWVSGDVIGMLCDLESRQLHFSINGSLAQPMGLAFDNLVYVEGLRPCLTLNQTCALRVNLGGDPVSPLRHVPPGYKPVSQAPCVSPLGRRWGYLFQVRPLDGLKFLPVKDFTLLSCDSKGERERAEDAPQLWRPKLPRGYASLGDIFSRGCPPSSSVAVANDGNPMLADPVGYDRVWCGALSNGVLASIWRPRPPPGFVALGDVFSMGDSEPGAEGDGMNPMVVCVSVDAVEKESLAEPHWWDPEGGAGDSSPEIAETPESSRGVAISRVRNQVGSFLAFPGESKEPLGTRVPDYGWRLLRVSDSVSNIFPASEKAVMGDPSILWACWSVSQLVDSAKADLTAAWLPLAANALREVFVNLWQCYRSQLIPSSGRAIAAATLSQILIARDLLQIPLTQADLAPILIVGSRVLSVCFSRVREGLLGLPPAALRLVDLLLAAHTASKFMAATEGPNRSLAPPSLSSEEQCLLSVMNMVQCVNICRQDSSDEDSFTRSSPVFLGDDLVDLWRYYASQPVCVHSSHPLYQPGEEGIVELVDEQGLEILFDSRCRMPPSMALMLSARFEEAGESSSLLPSAAQLNTDFETREVRAEKGSRIRILGSRFQWKIVSTSERGAADEPRCWGLAFTAVPSRSPMLHMVKQGYPSQSISSESEIDLVQALEDWSPERDSALVEWINTLSDAREVPSSTISPFDFCPSSEDFAHRYSGLEDVPIQLVFFRIALLKALNAGLQQVLPALDTTTRSPSSSSRLSATGAGRLSGITHLIFRDVKLRVMELAKIKTQGDGGSSVTITLDNFLASRSAAGGDTDVWTSKCIFVQAFKALHFRDPRVLRSCWDEDRVFQVAFRGEKGSDAGGVFREAMSRMVDDLFSGALDLLIPSPNAAHGVHIDNDKFIPNPRYAGTAVAISMLEFLGKLMGVSLRTNLCLPFRLPSVVWKGLLGIAPSLADVKEYDALAVQLLHEVQTAEDERDWDSGLGAGLYFVRTVGDGSESELLPGGSSKAVTWDLRAEFCERMERHLLYELQPAIGAIERGMATVVPPCATALFTPRELEIIVCGDPDFDMPFWRAHTTYSGYTAEHTTIKLFWKVMEGLSRDERSGFVRFAWGRDRLPPHSTWCKDMQITRRNTDERDLPRAHTCFFQVELPPYSTEERMRSALKTVCQYGTVAILLT
jgi:hypothetical protein